MRCDSASGKRYAQTLGEQNVSEGYLHLSANYVVRFKHNGKLES